MPSASVKVFAATSIVVAPAAVGVKVAVYTVLLVAVKSEIVPPVTLISPMAKLLVASLEVNVKVRVASFVVAPSATAVPLLLAAVMVMAGPTLS